MNATDDPISRLEGLSAEVLAIDPSDKDAIVQVGAGVEQMIQVLGEDSPAAGFVVQALEALQAAYQQESPDSSAMDAVACALYSAAKSAKESQEAAECVSAPAAPEATPAPAPVEAAAPAPCEKTTGTCAPRQDTPTPAAAQVTRAAAAQPPAAPGAQSAPILPADTDMDLLKEFVTECLDHITAGETSLLNLEGDPENAELVNTIFRAFHTIKGTSGFLGLDRIQRCAHLAENLLMRARDGQIRIVGEYADLALKSCDALRTMIEGLCGAEPGKPLAIPADLDDLLVTLADPEKAGISEQSGSAGMRLGDILVGMNAIDKDALEQVACNKQEGKLLGEALIETGVAKGADVAQALRTQKKIEGDAADGTIRVGTGRLDILIEMVGELVIAQSMVTQDPNVAQGANVGLSRKVLHAGKIVRELQDLTMSLRMVPLKALFQKMTRLVRDLGKKSGKQAHLVTEGEGTEIDRSMVEVLGDPLVHMIRNSVDHGLEGPEDRVKAGKNPTGTVTLRAYQAAGNVVIELCDDGRGLNREKIIAKAVEKGLIQAGREVSDSEAFGMIFRPGFSTADKITDVSGRGVGMDVVRKALDSLRARIDILSRPGEGTTFSMRLPLTMAICDAMVLSVGTEQYLLPTIAIEQSFRPTPESVSTVVGRGEMVLLRGELLPVFRLAKLFGVHGAVTVPAEGLMVIITGQSARCALMVDKLLGQQQVVIKSLGKTFSNVAGVAGGAILGDGRVGLILDASGLVSLTRNKAA
jgi:two-component system chemotaxis sensor kinase CheA